MPPLRERGEDIRLLFEHFLAVSVTAAVAAVRASAEVLDRLPVWPWPGNVRELRSLAERLAVLAGDPIDLEELPEPLSQRRAAVRDIDDLERTATGVLELREFRAAVRKQHIEAVLERTGWNVSEAARLLGIHRSRLHQKLKQLGTQRP